MIEWATPPEPTAGGNARSIWNLRKAELREKPGKWGRFGPYNRPKVCSMARYVTLHHGLEAVGRVEGSYGYVYARWPVAVPNPDDGRCS